MREKPRETWRVRLISPLLAIFKLKLQAMFPLLLLLASFSAHAIADESFDVRQHLSTVSRYGAVKDIVVNSYVPAHIPDGCTPIHLNLVARHGTRAPTKKRMKEMERLATSLQALIAGAKERKVSLDKVPSWLFGWTSPWKGKVKGGELIEQGESELYDFGIRIREKYPNLLGDEYHPDVYPIRATQVPRASASAVAFAMGLFSGRGRLGPGKHRAFAVSSESRSSDILLRFHDTCQNYKNYRVSEEPTVEKLKEPIFDEITVALSRRYELNFTRQDISSLWFLCKQEASLLDLTDQACGLFNSTELALLEWTDDLEVFILKGYGKSINRMGLPLLKDVVEAMELAIKAHEESLPSGSYEKARLRFAHAETVIPFSCLLGLFLEGSGYSRIQREEPLEFPPKPPKKRTWRGSVVAPFGGNNMLLLYSCPAEKSSKYYVHVLHNEHPVPLPGCDNTDFCAFDVFKERILKPHVKHDYHALCSVKEQPVQKPAPSKLSLFGWLFSAWGADVEPRGADL